jgi:hypothetical protein
MSDKIVGINCAACHRCLEGVLTEGGWPVVATRMILCSICWNKRCPHATDCALDCTESNEPGQKGSIWENYKIQ